MKCHLFFKKSIPVPFKKSNTHKKKPAFHKRVHHTFRFASPRRRGFEQLVFTLSMSSPTPFLKLTQQEFKSIIEHLQSMITIFENKDVQLEQSGDMVAPAAPDFSSINMVATPYIPYSSNMVFTTDSDGKMTIKVPPSSDEENLKKLKKDIETYLSNKKAAKDARLDQKAKEVKINVESVIGSLPSDIRDQFEVKDNRPRKYGLWRRPRRLGFWEPSADGYGLSFGEKEIVDLVQKLGVKNIDGVDKLDLEQKTALLRKLEGAQDLKGEDRAKAVEAISKQADAMQQSERSPDYGGALSQGAGEGVNITTEY